MFDKLEAVDLRFQEIESRLADPDLANRQTEFRRLTQEHADLQEIVAEYRTYKNLQKELQSNKELLDDPEFADLAKEEIKRIETDLESLTERLQLLLLPKDPNDEKNIVLEIRAGAGGDEAGLFVADLFRMYQKFSEKMNWSVSLLSSNPTGVGGYKEIIAMIEGQRVYSRLKYEAGVHRVQRVPETEAQGRIHTSTVTVAVLPEAEEVEIDINPTDLRIDVFRAGGKGGQGVNTTDSAVRITHIPSGTVVACQDERSQLKNKARAMKILRSRLLDMEQTKAAKEHADSRKEMVGPGDRSERIRTYNFPQGRITDHRIGLTLYNLPEFVDGKIEEVIDQLQTHYQAEALKAQETGS